MKWGSKEWQLSSSCRLVSDALKLAMAPGYVKNDRSFLVTITTQCPVLLVLVMLSFNTAEAGAEATAEQWLQFRI